MRQPLRRSKIQKERIMTMGRAKGSGKKPAQDAQEPVHGTENPKVDVAPAEVQKAPEIEEVKQPEKAPTVKGEVADKDQFRHHATLEPRIFKKGEVIPVGWEKTYVRKKK
jgi:hypothetical protein